MKRIFDLALILLFSPLLMLLTIITAVIVLVTMGWPIIFSQYRPGLKGNLFKMYKFRTMTNEMDEDGRLLDDSKRITRSGKILRKLSLDELPEILNVVKGDMSLVGPRPLHVRYLALYSDKHRKRHDVLPGITGLAQVSGRNRLSWDERLDLDVEYVLTRSLRMDLEILIKTAKVVFTGADVSAPGHATMQEFKGSKNKSSSEVDK